MSVLLDTGFILAAFNRRDRLHRWARGLMREILSGGYGPAYVTDYIVDEVLTYAAARLGAAAARRLGELLLERMVFHIIPVTMDTILEAWRIYSSHLPRLSFTDAATLAVARSYGIDYIVTPDGELARLHQSITPG